MGIKRIIMAIAAVILLQSCIGPSFTSDEEAFTARQSVCAVVGNKDMIDFSTGSIHTSFNQSKHIYRAGVSKLTSDADTGDTVEIVSEFYVLVLEAAPGAVQSAVKGCLYLTSSALASGFRTYDVELSVLKIEGSLIWLWDPSLKVGIVARIAE